MKANLHVHLCYIQSINRIKAAFEFSVCLFDMLPYEGLFVGTKREKPTIIKCENLSFSQNGLIS